MEIRGNDSSFRPSDSGRPEPVDRPNRPGREGAEGERALKLRLAAQRAKNAEGDAPTRRPGGQEPEVVTDELSKRQLRQVRLANIAADQRAENAGTERPVPGGGVDSIQVSSDAERLAKVEDTVRKFEVPSRGARLAELRKSFEAGELNSSELILKAAQQMLDSGDSRVG